MARRALEEVAAWVHAAEIDVLALQEVDVCWSGANTLRQAEALAKILGGTQRSAWQQAYLPGFDYSLGLLRVTTGVAILSRRTITATHTHRFSQRRRGVKGVVKGALLGAKAALEVTIDGRLRVIDAHLTHDDDRQREYELATLLDVCTDGRGPCVLAGDLNTTPPATRSSTMREAAHFATDRCFEVLERHRGAWDPQLPVTYPAEAPDLKLDYVIVFGATASPETVHPPLAGSNHRPVSRDLEMKS